MTQHFILWQNLHTQGHEAARLTLEAASSGLRLDGTAIFLYKQAVCQLHVCDQMPSKW